MDDLLDWLTIALLPGVGPRILRELLTRSSVGEVSRDPARHRDLLPDAAVRGLDTGATRRAALEEMSRAQRLGVRLVCLADPDYPALLRQIYDPPPVLWVKGHLSADDRARPVALVGTRAASSQGRSLARGMARDLARAGVTVVSGLARGIDTAAHEGALEGGGATLAVLGSGVDRVYPAENEPLAGRIAEGGAVLSELPLQSPPLAAHFPRRNRIIAGLCSAVVVVEAPLKSGALVTARLALDEGRDVFAVPGHPASAGAAGTNALIRDGAVLVRDALDVAEALGMEMLDISAREPQAGDELLRFLERDRPLTLDEIQERSGRSASELLAELTSLELQDQVRRLPGALYRKS